MAKQLHLSPQKRALNAHHGRITAALADRLSRRGSLDPADKGVILTNHDGNLNRVVGVNLIRNGLAVKRINACYLPDQVPECV